MKLPQDDSDYPIDYSFGIPVYIVIICLVLALFTAVGGLINPNFWI
ncbi:hypothetical protein EDF68_11428 [Ochrobactrum sp. BH3]|nr:hypothetical protein EDF68_12218 [Ochrobactrum sp. BH3]TCQ74742.1 hypothetical protein EDF68_11428 [Ochrobactrum sp. BH3]